MNNMIRSSVIDLFLLRKEHKGWWCCFLYNRLFGIEDEKEQDIRNWTEPGNKCL